MSTNKVIANWDFSGDEIIALIVAGCAAAYSTGRFYNSVLFTPIPRNASAKRQRLFLALTPILGLPFLAVVLWRWADPVHVAHHIDYVILFIVIGAAWIGGVITALPLIGISARDDAIERANPAATITTIGAIVGIILIYAGANIGYGATIWTTLAPALLASGAWFVLWLIFQWLTRAAESIAVERDVPSAFRLAMTLVCTGAIFGRAVVGDWNGWDGMMSDFRRLSWPAVLIFLAWAILQFALRGRRAGPKPS